MTRHRCIDGALLAAAIAMLLAGCDPHPTATTTDTSHTDTPPPPMTTPAGTWAVSALTPDPASPYPPDTLRCAHPGDNHGESIEVTVSHTVWIATNHNDMPCPPGTILSHTPGWIVAHPDDTDIVGAPGVATVPYVACTNPALPHELRVVTLADAPPVHVGDPCPPGWEF